MDRGAWQATIHGVAESDTKCHFSLELSFLFGLWVMKVPKISPVG